MKKVVALSAFALIGGLYTTFVLQRLWNWFVMPIFHTSQLSFWAMYGIQMFFGVLKDRTESNPEEHRWNIALAMLDKCVPEHARDAIEQELKSQETSMWISLGSEVIGYLFG